VAFSMPRPATVAWLAAQPGPKVVAEVPVPKASNGGAFELFASAATLHPTLAWRPTIHGYSGIRSERHDRAFRDMNTFPDAGSLEAMRSLGVTHVIAHRRLYPPDAWQRLGRELRTMAGLRVLHEDADGLVAALEPAEIQ